MFTPSVGKGFVSMSTNDVGPSGPGESKVGKDQMSESQDTEQRDPEQDNQRQDAEQADHEREPDPNSEERDATSSRTVVPGVDTDPDSKKKSIVVDTNQRLEDKDGHRDEVPDDQLEQERQERLDPENRPDNTEVDNSDRTFDPKTGLFEDTDLEPPDDAPYSTTEAEESNTEDSGNTAEPEDREESTDAEQSKESKESKDTEGAQS